METNVRNVTRKLKKISVQSGNVSLGTHRQEQGSVFIWRVEDRRSGSRWVDGVALKSEGETLLEAVSLLDDGSSGASGQCRGDEGPVRVGDQ